MAKIALGRLAQDKLATLGLLEARVFPLGLQLPEYSGIERCRRCLAAGGGPVALGGHGLDHLLAVHGLARFAEHLGGGVQRAELFGPGLGLGLLRLLGCVSALGCRALGPLQLAILG